LLRRSVKLLMAISLRKGSPRHGSSALGIRRPACRSRAFFSTETRGVVPRRTSCWLSELQGQALMTLAAEHRRIRLTWLISHENRLVATRDAIKRPSELQATAVMLSDSYPNTGQFASRTDIPQANGPVCANASCDYGTPAERDGILVNPRKTLAGFRRPSKANCLSYPPAAIVSPSGLQATILTFEHCHY